MAGIRTDFWGGLTVRVRIKLAAAVFFTFATLGIFQDMWAPGIDPWPWVVLRCVASGLTALTWAFAFRWSKKFIPVMVIMTVMSAVLNVKLGHMYPDTQHWTIEQWRRRNIIEAVACALMVIIGYVVFIRFIGTEGAERLRLATEVNLAKEIHEVLVPPVNQTIGRIDVFGRSKPSAEVGGDLLDVFAEDHGVMMMVADVSGHGVAAGTMMGMLKSAARIKLADGVTLDSLLHDLNRILFQVKSDRMFATVAALHFHPHDTVEVAMAGHLPVLHVVGQTGEVALLHNENIPLGILEDATFGSRTVAAARGDVFVLLTDGLTEVENKRGDELGWEPICGIVSELRSQPLSEIYDAIMGAVTAHGRQVDDQTLALLRLN